MVVWWGSGEVEYNMCDMKICLDANHQNISGKGRGVDYNMCDIKICLDDNHQNISGKGRGAGGGVECEATLPVLPDCE